jgi:ribosomal-protein-alanine N-acetyltransferase
MMGVHMTVMWAQPEQLEIVRELLAHGHRRQVDLGAEDLAAAVARGEALLGIDGSGAWGVLVLTPAVGAAEPAAGCTRRVYLRGATFRHGSSPSHALHHLFEFYRRQARRQPELVVAYGGDGWYERALAAAGFRLTEQVVYFELTDLARRVWPAPAEPSPAHIRAADPSELNALIAVDGAAFELLWQLSARDLTMLHMVGQVLVAEHNGTVVGYLAQTYAGAAVHVARLAVLPEYGGQGIGRRLLVAGLERARAAGAARVLLNTQGSNEPAQRLYRSLGFRRTGEQVSVFTAELPV